MKTVLWALACLSIASQAYAFSDPAKFALSPLEGGGGGRFFTGSPADGFACAVCHRGGKTPKVTIHGLPIAEFTPLQTYEVEVTFDQLDKSHAIALELLSQKGTAAGHVELLEESEIKNKGYCEQNPTLGIASYLTEAAGRRIVGLSDCAATSLRFRFTAPDERVVLFSLAMVVSDNKGDSEGDSSLHATRTLYRAGEKLPPVQGVSSCSTLDPGRPSATPWLIWLALIATFLRRPGNAWLRSTLVIAVITLPACARVAPYERGTLARPDMALATEANLAAGEEHAVAYREGASGGGSAKGGGCGCN